MVSTASTAKHRRFSPFVLAASVLVATSVYWWEAEADRAQRQCVMFVDAMKTSNMAAVDWYSGMSVKADYWAVPRATTLAAMLNMQPENRRFCYYPPYAPDRKQGE